MINFVLLTRITLDNNSLVATTGYNSNLCYQTRSCPKLGGTVKWCIVIFLCQFCHKDHGQNFKQLLAPCQTPRNIFDFSINSAKRTETNLGHKLFDGDSRGRLWRSWHRSGVVSLPISNCGIWKSSVRNDISKPIMAFIIIIILRLWSA